MKKIVTFCLLFSAMLPMKAQNILSLDSCRAMALRNNKQINASRLKKDIAYNLKKSARTKYLPKVDALGGYEWFNREISLLNSNQKSAISNIGSNLGAGVTNNLSTMMGELVSQGLISQEAAQQIGQALGSKLPGVTEKLNGAGKNLVDAFRTDTRNIWAGSIMLRQPIYMGGAIIAANKIADIGEQMAANDIDMQTQNTLYNIDQAYWMVVSLRQKQKLANSYREIGRAHV